MREKTKRFIFFKRARKNKIRKRPLVPRVPPKPKPQPFRSDPFLLKRDAEALNVPFSQWYTLYDLNIAQDQCRRLWITLTNEERQTALQHTPAYVRSTPNKRYRKAPTNYLETKVFNDEIINRHEADSVPNSSQSDASPQREIIRTDYGPQKFKRSSST
ncbi:hypothetical protein [Spirosoma endbachense]|uniref:Uncharacterized protein n=1 Tax=Spirosoma endbachense TaxID=2666025 RepID=A0A6P1W5P9_9BACT|nr:hypothetical protein [Spirosoma endbachense]QHV99260.1 hypothetical protein GJR95_31480 [Spirosoma endbachense]